MKCKRFAEEQIIGVLKEHEAGCRVLDLARRQCVAENTLYRWVFLWAERTSAALHFTQPGKADAERLCGELQREISGHLFEPALVR